VNEATMSAEIIAKIQAFLRKRFRNYEFADDEDIFATGVVNSLFAMQLVMFVEKEFGIEVSDDDLTLDNFRTVDAMAQLVRRKNDV
jgi:acyl carrier protein